MDDLVEMSDSGFEAGQETTSSDQPGSGLPKYFSLVFQIIMTMIILPMAGWCLSQSKLQEVYISPITSLWPT